MRIRVIAAAAGLLALVPLAAAPAATSAAAGQPAAAPAAVPMTGARVITLPTGQQVALYGPPGAPASFGPPPGVTWPADDPITGATMNGHLYAIPASALPTLAGHLEDYDLTRLAGAPAAPATVAPRPAAGRGGSRNYWTLTINPVPASGAITFYALVQLMNVDDAAKFATTTGIGPQGESFSVPQGHYSLVAVFFGLENGQLVNRTVVNPEFTVDAPTTITADASSATVDPSASVSQPASLGLETMTVTRTARKNGGLGILSDSPGQAFTLLVNPTARVHTGSLHYDTYWHFVSPDSGASYTYDLDYPSVGSIPAEQAHPAPSGSTLAAIGTHYASEVPGQSAAAGRTVIDLAGLGALGFTQLNPITVPAERTEYVTASPGVHWQSSVVRLANTFEDWFSDAVRTYQPGSQPTETWLREPLTPGVAQFAQPWYEPLLCPACREGDNLNLIIEPYADGSGHVAVQPTVPGGTQGDVASGSYTLTSGGTVLGTGSYPDGVQIPIPHTAARYQLSYDVTRSAPWWTQSTTSSTEWTFTSAPSNANLPPGWFCTATGITKCTVLPLIFADYRLPVDDTGHEPPGPVTGEIDVHHLQGAASVPVTSVTLRVSFDGGHTWQQADVTPAGGGRYQASYVNPAGAAAADLWLTAADAQGNTLSQVIHQVYAITTP